MNILPGEPVPPGFEDEMDQVAEIQTTIDMYKGNALIGLEYTVELSDDDRREPGYFCVLCEKRGDPRTIMQHWTSFNHRVKYLEKHYSTAMRGLQPVKYKPNSSHIMVPIVQKLAEAIEDHHGRLRLPVCGAEEFQRHKRKVTNEICQKFHFDERSGPNFVNIIERHIREPKGGGPNGGGAGGFKANGKGGGISIKPPKRLLNAGSVRDGGLDEISSDSDHESKKQRKSDPLATSPKNSKPIPTPKQLAFQSTQIGEEGYKWEKYRCTLEIALKQLTDEQKVYEKNPEKHPLYADTWKKYWSRRYKEIEAENKVDPNKYDYKPEWIVHWNDRMAEIFEEEVAKKKAEVKRKVGLPDDAVENVELLRDKYKLPVQGKESSAAAAAMKGDDGADVIAISDDEGGGGHPIGGGGRAARRSRSRRRSSSSSSLDYRRSHGRSRGRSRSPSPDYERFERRPRGHAPAASASHGYVPLDIDSYYGSNQLFSRSKRIAPHGIPRPPPPSQYRLIESKKYYKYERSPSPADGGPGSRDDKSNATEAEEDGPLTVVSVLRLLTALEGNLGSMGPKVVDMLAKALALEKVKANSADDLLLDERHSVFFETIKEKLKGLLIADMVDEPQQVRIIKKAVQNIASVIHQVNSRAEKQEKSSEVPAAGPQGKANETRQLPFDRQLVATKLAAFLVMQGREDVSTADMDKLIGFFVLMAKISHGEGRTVHMKDVCYDLGISPPKGAAANPTALAAVDDFLENSIAPKGNEERPHDAAAAEKAKSETSNSNMLEALTDSDLQTLLQNFKHLSADEQHHLAAYLKKLQTTDPQRVMRLSKYINSTQPEDLNSPSSSSGHHVAGESAARRDGRSSRFEKEFRDTPSAPSTSRAAAAAAAATGNRFTIDDEDDEDDYSFDDVFKAASSNIQKHSEAGGHKGSKGSPLDGDKSKESGSDPLKYKSSAANVSLSDTQNIIANLMGSLQQSNNSARKSNLTPSPSSAKTVQHDRGLPQSSAQAAPSAALNPHGQQQAAASSLPFYQQQQQSQMHHQQGDHFGYGNQMAAGVDPYYNMNAYNQNGAYMGGPGGYQWGPGGAPNMNMGNMPPQYQMGGYGMQQQYNMYGQQNRH